jgi:hypothetical protein
MGVSAVVAQGTRCGGDQAGPPGLDLGFGGHGGYAPAWFLFYQWCSRLGYGQAIPLLAFVGARRFAFVARPSLLVLGPQQRWWLALAEAEVTGRFGSQLRKKFLFLPTHESATVTPMGVTNLLGGAVVDFAIYLDTNVSRYIRLTTDNSGRRE